MKADVATVRFTVGDAALDGYIYDPDGNLGGVPNAVSGILLNKP
jgi:hypothetical protein